RMSRGSKGAIDSALKSDLAVLRNAIELYQIEHDGLYPTVTDFHDQLETYSSITGATSPTKNATHYLGPYIATVPAVSVGANKGLATVGDSVGPGLGWIYDEATGEIYANADPSLQDDRGVAYVDY